MIAFPFSNAFAMERAKNGNQGEYMALYTIAFSFAHIFSHNSGMQLVSAIGFDSTWVIVTSVAALSAFFMFLLLRILKNEKSTNYIVCAFSFGLKKLLFYFLLNLHQQTPFSNTLPLFL